MTEEKNFIMTTQSVESLKARIQALENELEKYKAAERTVRDRLKRFDELDFEGYSEGIPNNNFTVFNDIHTENVRVYNPGELEPATTNITDHDQAMLPLFQMFPDHKIKVHPVAFGQGDWTCVLGVIEGSFTGTMTGPDGKTIPPTGKPFQSMMATVAKWEGNRISDEYLFISMDDIMKKVGVTQ
jgi:hypothetical protein